MLVGLQATREVAGQVGREVVGRLKAYTGSGVVMLVGFKGEVRRGLGTGTTR